MLGVSPLAQCVKNPPATQETQVQALGWEDPLKEEMATHSSILAWEIPWTEGPGWLQSKILQRVRHNWTTDHSTIITNYHNLFCLSMSYININMNIYTHTHTHTYTYIIDIDVAWLNFHFHATFSCQLNPQLQFRLWPEFYSIFYSF